MAEQDGLTITRVFDAPRERVCEYYEVVEPERLGFPLSDQPGEDAHELITVVLTDLGDARTEMLFEQRGQLSADQYGRAKEGWSSFFDRLAERLAGT